MIQFSQNNGRYLFTTSEAVCATTIGFELREGKVYKIVFHGGCPGQGRAVSKLCNGQDVYWVIETFKDVKCGNKTTSCSAQLAMALQEAMSLIDEINEDDE